MSNIIKTNIINAVRDGSAMPANACRNYGEIDGYSRGFLVEVQCVNGTYGYSSVCFVDFGASTDFHMPYDENGDYAAYNDLGIHADMCLHSGNELTGNIVFCGYYEERAEYDEDGAYYSYIPASKTVIDLWNKWVINE